LLAEILAWEIRRQLLNMPAKPRRLKLAPVARDGMPAGEKVSTVPASYRKYFGDHPDHPGEGKGRGAARRDNRTLDLFPQRASTGAA
jgi:DNA (cytosine-5)-methyltransferase 1